MIRTYERKPCTLEELKEAISVEVAKIDRAMLQRMYANFIERLQKCIIDKGYRIQDVVFHT